MLQVLASFDLPRWPWSKVPFICAWGPDCERVHDIFDEVLLELHMKQSWPHVMTTWHDRESLHEALWYALNSTYPDEVVARTCRSFLAVSVSNDEWPAQNSPLVIKPARIKCYRPFKRMMESKCAIQQPISAWSGLAMSGLLC